MNAALKHWKEAATLILAAGRRVGTPSPVGSSHLTHRWSFDYDILLLKRSSRSGFMPNAYVFPGGMLDSSDFSSEWCDVFTSSSRCSHFGLTGVKQPAETRPPIFATDRQKLGSPIPGEVAVRICALRETFEESGVLLCVSKAEEKAVLDRSEDQRAAPHKANGLCSSELVRWRTLVNQNPSNFIKMCRELEVVPNIWALHEWSNWLTPTGRYGATRFDTAFFVCCLQEVPHTLQDQKEIVRFQVRGARAAAFTNTRAFQKQLLRGSVLEKNSDGCFLILFYYNFSHLLLNMSNSFTHTKSFNYSVNLFLFTASPAVVPVTSLLQFS